MQDLLQASPAGSQSSPHYSRRLLLQPPIRRYDTPVGGRARRSVGQHTVSSMPPSRRWVGPDACLASSYKGGQPPCTIPTNGAHPLRNPQAVAETHRFTAPRARLAWRLGGFVTNSRE